MARTVEAVQADIDALYAARAKLIAGERVNEVWRDGRRLTFGTVTVESLQQALGQLEQELSNANAAAAPDAAGYSSGRRPFTMVW